MEVQGPTLTCTMERLRVGKLPSELLVRLLSRIRARDERVVVGPTLGEDAAVIRLADRELIAKTDPITFASDLIGWYAVNINANDVATMGGYPRWFLASILLPEGSMSSDAERIFQQIESACEALEIDLVGGHLEVTHELSRPIVVGCMLGECEGRSALQTGDARLGDDLLLTKGIAVEGTAVLAREAAEALSRVGVSPADIEEAAQYLFSPGISVVEEALTAARFTGVHAMHDPTEGGLATGLREMATAAQVGIVMERDQVVILHQTQVLCEALKLDPLGLLASGALLIAAAPETRTALLAALTGGGIQATVIGKLVDASQGMRMRTNRGLEPLPLFERDELAVFFETH